MMTTMTMEPTKTDDAVAVDKATATATILKKSVCLSLTCSYLGNSRKVDLNAIDLKKHADVEGGEDLASEKDELRLSKQLLDRRDLKKCASVIAAAKHYLRSIATQTHRVFGSGTYLVKKTEVLAAVARLKEFKADLAIAVDDLVAQYPKMVEKRKAELGPLFHAGDYLTAEEVRSEYSLKWSFVSFAAPEQLEEVDQALYEAIKEQKSEELSGAFDEVVLQLRAAALTVVSELAERLAPGDDGKPKAIRGTALRDIQEFAALLPKRNLADDDALTAAIAKVSAYAEGLDPEVLRKAPAVREQLQKHAAEAAAQIAGLVETARKRSITFGKIV
jgi:hypothetical protein